MKKWTACAVYITSNDSHRIWFERLHESMKPKVTIASLDVWNQTPDLLEKKEHWPIAHHSKPQCYWISSFWQTEPQTKRAIRCDMAAYSFKSAVEEKRFNILPGFWFYWMCGWLPSNTHNNHTIILHNERQEPHIKHHENTPYIYYAAIWKTKY
jgi:hypothetical protein